MKKIAVEFFVGQTLQIELPNKLGQAKYVTGKVNMISVFPFLVNNLYFASGSFFILMDISGKCCS